MRFMQALGLSRPLVFAALVLGSPAAVGAAFAEEPGSVPLPIRSALAAVDLAPEQFRLDPLDMQIYGGDRWKLPIFDPFAQQPFRIPGDVEVIQRTVLNAAGRPSDLFGAATARLGTGVRRGLIGDPTEEIRARLPARDPLPAAVRALWRLSGLPLPPEKDEEIRNLASRLPDSLGTSLALLLQATVGLIEAREQAVAPVFLPTATGAWGRNMDRWQRRSGSGPSVDRALDPIRFERDAVAYVIGSGSEDPTPSFLRSVEEPAASIDFPVWNAGIADLLLVLEKVLPVMRRQSTSLRARTFPLRIDTPYGPVLLAGPGPDRHGAQRGRHGDRNAGPSDDPLLLLDTGGNDVYLSGGGATWERPVSILIDLGGNDTYAAADTSSPAFGAGLLGLGVLIDEAGDDVYRGGHLSLGAGMYGAGILIDRAGGDRYDGITATQGAGLFGVGILSDLGGDDSYHAFQQAQGYGYVRGAGILLDRSGNDSYDADDVTIRYPSAQSKEHNSSLAQGFGFGKRSDTVDGHSLAGGIGILVDGGGNDTYRCGIFGQGAGYWYGIGILADGAGDDQYDGIWYVQGSAAHFALGILWEGDGNDRYRASMNMAQGAGHDFSLGFLYERAGDDRYDAPNLSLGGGNANGIGLFWDRNGDDLYRVEAATTLGRANTASRGGMRDRIDTIGLFLDTGGIDSYPYAKGFAGNGRLWTQTGTDEEHPLDTERGAGIDTTWAPGGEPGWRARRGR
jgi:hypothetical protein